MTKAQIEKIAENGYDFVAEICYGSLNNLWNAVLDYREGYDVDEEAALWIREVGLGNRGMPRIVRDVISDFEECEQALEVLANDLRNAA